MQSCALFVLLYVCLLCNILKSYMYNPNDSYSGVEIIIGMVTRYGCLNYIDDLIILYISYYDCTGSNPRRLFSSWYLHSFVVALLSL